ncbi:MAG TPA: histidine kinase [Acidobacteriota bacterium]|nr:histidine kinase [Acidobacteriota bacterium]
MTAFSTRTVLPTNQALEDEERLRFADLIPSAVLRWSLYFAFWTAMGVLNAATAVTDVARLGVPSYKPIIYEMSSLYTIGLLVPLVVWLTHRYPLRDKVWMRHFGVHLLALPVFSLAHTGGMIVMRMAAFWAFFGEYYDFSNSWIDFRNDLLYEFFKDIGLYWVIVFLAQGWLYYSRYRGQQLQASHLQNRLLEARLENLKGRLQPHFLFNTLNMISSLMHEDVDAADRMITRLSDLLRLSLAAEGRQLVPLREELETLQIYLEIMQARFSDALQSEIEVESGVGDWPVPPFLLQPLVENAVRHGLSPRSQGGRLRVHIGPIASDENTLQSSSSGDRQDPSQERLRLVVEDDGIGTSLSADEMLNKGRGLSSTVERLQRLYPDTHRFALAKSPLGGLRVEITLPRHPHLSQETL